MVEVSLVRTIKRCVYLCAVAFAVVHIAPAGAAPVLQDAPSVAIEDVMRSVRHAVSAVSGAPVAAPAADDAPSVDTLPVQEDPEWIRFSAGDAEIWLPASFEGGDLDQDLDLVVDLIRGLGPDFSEVLNLIEQNPSAFRLIAVDTAGLRSGVATNVAIASEQVFSFMDTELYLSVVDSALPPQFEIVEQGRISVPGFEDASRVIMSVSVPGGAPMNQLMYVILDDSGTMWAINFTVAESELDSWILLSKRSIDSFTVAQE